MSGPAQRVIDACSNNWEANKSDCSAFVKAVAEELQIPIPLFTNADAIIDYLATTAAWTELSAGFGASAKASADGGHFVIGGLRGNELNPNQAHGHVLVVMSGPLDSTHRKYPRAAWGRLGSVGERDSFVNFSFNSTDRDRVRYFAIDVP